jgi:hypothetical protein
MVEVAVRAYGSPFTVPLVAELAAAYRSTGVLALVLAVMPSAAE